MDGLYDWLVKLGPGWMGFILIGTIGGAIAYLVSHRQYMKMLREGHADQIKLKDETITMLEQAKTQAVATLESSNKDITKERDMYRDKLHEEKAHHQSTLLRLTELESRPDLSQILKLEKDFHDQKMAVQGKMLDALTRLDTKIDNEHRANAKLSQDTAKALTGLTKFLETKGILPQNHTVTST